jgi:CDGSH-type Zn-finger protein
MTRIHVRPNSHYLVDSDDDVIVVDWDGNAYQVPNRRAFALCRCGGSRNKPFCDGTHGQIGFQAADAAVSGRNNKPV